MSNTTRNDVKNLAKTIESLAKDVQLKLDTDGDFLSSSNELVRNNMTFVFTLGEFYALQQAGTKPAKTKKVAAVSSSTGMNSKWHNVRDNLGRFTRKV